MTPASERHEIAAREVAAYALDGWASIHGGSFDRTVAILTTALAEAERESVWGAAWSEKWRTAVRLRDCLTAEAKRAREGEKT